MTQQPDAVDSFDPPDPPELAEAGILLACRYLSTPPNPKNVTEGEIQSLHANGIGVLLNWEGGASRTLSGAAAGAADGAQAGAMARELGAPAGTVIYFSTDFDAVPAQYPTIAAYYVAASDALPPEYGAGAYGHGALIDYLTQWGDIQAAWQTYAWSNGYRSPHADLYQYLNSQHIGSSAVDFDLILRPANLGAWWAPNSPPIDPPQSTGDDDMELIRNTNTGAVIAHLGGGVLNPVDLTTYQVWLDLGRPVTQLQTGPWQHYTNWLAAGDEANIAAIAQATEQAIATALEN